MKRPATKRNVTDRAKRYRAQNNVTGPRVCVMCGERLEPLMVMHLDGFEEHGEQQNLAWGCRSCNGILAARFKELGAGAPTNQYNPAKGRIPTFEQYVWAVRHHTSEAHDEGGAVIHATPRHKRIEYARRIAEFNRSRRSAADDARWNPAEQLYLVKLGRTGLWRVETEDGRVVSPVFDRKKDAQAFIRDKKKTNPGRSTSASPKRSNSANLQRYDVLNLQDGNWHVVGSVRAYSSHQAVSEYRSNNREWSKGRKFKAQLQRSNPAAAAADGYREFHGHDPDVVTKVVEQRHTHGFLVGAGELVSLVVLGCDGRTHTVRDFGGAILAFNEARNQLFVKGGDQSVNLENFGISNPHELETLGKVKKIGYHTNKTHLGAEGGDAVYVHQFRTTNEDGRHVVVKVKRYPDLIYRVLEQQMEFSGGSYEIRQEGIDF